MKQQLATVEQRLLDPPDDEDSAIVRIVRTETIVRTTTIELRRKPGVRKVLMQTPAGLWSEVER